jgi:hypothetical protein
MRCLPKPRCRRYVVAHGSTEKTIAVPGGGQVRAGNADIPDFFDQAAWETKLTTGSGFPRAPGTARDFYGPNANALAIVLELPLARLRIPSGTIIAVWSRVTANGGRQDREGRPFINTGLIPKVPRTSTAPDLRDAFNRAVPETDRAAFSTAVTSVLTGFYGRSSVDANALTQFLLPDVLLFEVGNPNGFGTFIDSGQKLGNGRRLSDDVHDTMLNILSNGAITTDNVGDDNGLRITDGSVDPVSAQTRAIAFPYIGLPNVTPGGPNP